jgi:hypothetical protein
MNIVGAVAASNREPGLWRDTECAERRMNTLRAPPPLVVERLSYHAVHADLQALLAEDCVAALTIAAEIAFIALLRQRDLVRGPDLQRLRRHTTQLLKGSRAS